MRNIDFLRLAKKAGKIAIDKKAKDVIVLNIKDLTTIANYFVVTTAESAPQINAISGEIEKTFKYDDGIIPVRREGIASSTWRVIDYGGLIVHVMSPVVRSSYNLENVWREAKSINFKCEKKVINNIVKPKDNVKSRSNLKSNGNVVRKLKKGIKVKKSC
jgi:ribosome-associated protein